MLICERETCLFGIALEVLLKDLDGDVLGFLEVLVKHARVDTARDVGFWTTPF